MIAKLTGTLSVVADERVIVDCAGIGYEVLIPSFALSELSGRLGREVTLHTIEFIEGNVAAGGALVPRLVGFLRPDDRVFFGLFTRAKGMGMRKSLRAFAEPAERIAAAIESADAEAWLARAAQLHPDLAQPDEWIRAAYRIKGGADG